MKRTLLAISMVFIMTPWVYAASDKVEGGISCADWFNDGEQMCSFGIAFSGEITKTTYEQMKEVFEKNSGWRDKVAAIAPLSLNSQGGDVAAALAIGELLRKERMPVRVEKNAMCVSSCVFVLAGAVDRIISGKVGIHRPYFNPGRSTSPDEIRDGYRSLMGQLRSYLRKMNISTSLADDMLRIEPADVQFLSSGKLREYGLVARDPVEQETLDLQEANRFGLDRLDYIRRKMRTERECPPIEASIVAWRNCYDKLMRARP